jgi:cytochrome P450
VVTTTVQREADEVLRRLLTGPEGRREPYPLYHRLRQLAPVHRSDLDGMWYVSRYDTCREVLLDPRAGKAPLREADRPLRFGTNEEQVRRFVQRQRPSMLTSNPPDHTRLRAPARGPFMPRAMERLRGRIEEIVDERLDVVAAKGEADMMADVALELPVTVIGELVGVPPADRREFPPLVHEFFAASQAGATREEMDRAARAGERFRQYFDGLIAQRRSSPGDDLIGHLVRAEAGDGDGRGLSEDELQGTITLIFVAGFITTANLIGNGLLALFRQPQEMARLWDDAELVPTAVEEMLRFDSPVQLIERRALADLEVGGQAVRAGETVNLLLGAANRDPERFVDPDRLDVGRADGNGHVSFAWGIHHCLGAPLARLEGRVVFARLRERFSRLELLDPDPPRRPTTVLRSLASLPVRFVSA